MATFKELTAEWAHLNTENSMCTLADLQLAAELGKTLLERNKELETSLRQQQNIVDDRNQEIEYLTKQTAALREVNDSRLRIYEQLEISIQDLERNNQKLVQENLNDKKHIKSLYETIEGLESRCEELQHLVDDMGNTKKEDCSSASNGCSVSNAVADQDDYAKLASQLEHIKTQRAKEQRKVTELEKNVSLLLQENTNLEEKVSVMQQKDEELKVLQDQIVYLEEIRQGNLCKRCQRSADANLLDEYSMYDDDDDTDDISAIGSYVETHKNEVLQQLQETLGENYSADNPYRILVDKYEALLKIQQKQNALNNSGSKDQGISLHEELQMSGQFSSFNGNTTDSEDEAADKPATGKQHVFSETETSSSGFSDETSNKGTQTETFFTGSFLCTISDGDDCRFSIYDDASPIESRFRKTPEYRQLFREIFAVLKRAAEAKDVGEKLPLLQDDVSALSPAIHNGENINDIDEVAVPKVPPATPACENNPLVSSIEAVALTEHQHRSREPSQKQRQKQQQQQPAGARERRHKRHQQLLQERREPSETRSETALEEPRCRRDIIEELSAVKQKKHRNHHRRSGGSRQQHSKDISHLLEFKWTDHMTRRQRRTGSGENSEHRATWCVPKDDPVTDKGSPKLETTYASTASQEVAKLKLLDKSYAEVLRLDRKKLSRPHSQYFHKM